MSTTVQSISNPELVNMRSRLQRLAKQVNEYIQLNGCSAELKQKAKSLVNQLDKKKDQELGPQEKKGVRY